MPAELREHVLRVREIALDLARRHGADEGRVWLAASAHDIARTMDGARLLSRARELGIPIGPLEEAEPVLLHGPVGAELLRHHSSVDAEVYQAVYWHSTARAGMALVEKVVFLADKLDPEKASRYSYLSRLKVLVTEGLELAILEFLNRDMERLLRSGRLIHPASLEARNDLLLKTRSSSSPPTDPAP